MNRQIWAVLAIALVMISLPILVIDDTDGSSVSPDSFEVKYSGYNTNPTAGTVSVDGDTVTIDFNYRTVGGKQQVDSVDWGDGTVDVPKSGQEDMTIVKSSGLTLTHTYTQNGTYTITIDGHRWSYTQKSYVWDTVVVNATIDSIMGEVGGGDTGSSGTQSDPIVYTLEAGKRYELSLPPVGTYTKWYPTGSEPISIPGMGFSSSSGETDYIDESGFGTGQLGDLTLSGIPITSGTWDLYAYNPSTTMYYRIVVTGGEALIEIQSMTISGPSTIKEGERATYTVNISPASASSKVVQWSTNSSYSLISNETNTSCSLLGYEPTETITLTASAMDGSGKTASKTIEILRAEEIVETYDEISNVSGLRGMTMDGDYVLTSDITISGSWTPIGTESAPFNGTLDGNGHTITITSTAATALFGHIGEGGVVDHLAVNASIIVGDSPTDAVTRDNRDFTHSYLAAGIALENAGTIRQCSVSGTIIITSSPTGSLSGAYSAEWGPDVTVDIKAGSVAAINSGSISNCYSSAQVSATAQIHLTSTVTNTIAFGTADVLAAGIAAENTGSVSNCYSVGSVSESVSITSGGKVGPVDDTDNAVAGGVVSSNTGAVSGCYYLSGSVSGTASSFGTSRSSSQLQSQSTFSGWNFTDVWIMDGFPQLQALAGSVVFTSSTAASTVALGQAFLYTPSTNPFGATLSIVSDDTGCLTISGGVLKGTISGISPGTYYVVIQASYGSMTPATQTITINVPVTIIDPAEYSVYTGTQWTYDPETDPEGAEITLVSVKRNGSAVSNHGIVASDGVISGTFSEAGTWTITFTASYTTYEPTNKTVTVIVSEAPVIVDPPTLSGIVASPHYEQDRMFYFAAIGAGGYVTASWDFGDGSSSVTGTMSTVHRFSQSGLYDVTLTLANSEGKTVSKTVTVLVTDETSRGDAWVGVLYSTMVPIPSGSVPSLDGPDWLSVTTGTYDGQLYAIVSGTPGDTSLAGTTAEVRLTAGSTDERWSIEIHERKTTKPTATFDVDTDDGLTVTLRYTGQAASRIFIDWGEGAGMERQASVSGPFEHTYGKAGQYTVKIEVANNNGSLTSSKQINVREKVIEVSMGDIPDQQVAVGQELRIEVVTDPADAVLSISGADWLKIDGHTIVGTPPEGTEPAAYTITLKATYDGREPETAIFVVTVVETGDDDPEPTPEPDPETDDGPNWAVFAAVCVVALLLGIASRNPYVMLACVVGMIVAAYITGVIR